MKNVLITGGTTGIGLSIAKTFLENPEYSVISISRSQSKKSFEHERLFYYFCDISNISELSDIKSQILKNHNNLYALINNAGTIIPGGIETLTYEEWQCSMNNNLSSYFNVTKMFIDMLKKVDNSNIINISSISAKLGGSSVAYSVAKAGVNMFTQVAAREFSKYGIRVNTISPGIVNSGFQVANGMLAKEDYPSFLEAQSSSYPFGIGDVSEVAKTAYFLASDNSKWITGANITVDGGRSVMV